ncbi:MAG: outer membrane protein assembly factor BamD [bacterium]|nr:outer membrane protein assembly factor BamD [bacterium]
MVKISGKFVIIGLIVLTFISNCGRQKIKPSLPAEERMKIAEKMFRDEDYLDAKTEFRIIILNFPGSVISAKAQYMYAECHRELKEYIIAAAEYQKLLRVYPNSEYVDNAQFQIGLCYFKLSPKYSLDQEYTHKAIQEFQRFLEDFPNSELVADARSYMYKCRAKLARKFYRNAESYRKLTFYNSAIIYYDYVLDNYYDTEFAQKSLVGKANCYQKMGKSDEAIKFYQLYLDKYPKGAGARKVKSELEKIISDNS